MTERTFDAAKAHKLEDPRRQQWFPVGEIFARLGIQPGMAVADVGAGTGFFAIPMAREVRPEGAVFAVDMQPEMLVRLRQNLEAAGAPANVQVVEGAADRTGLKPESCHLALLANVWHEIEDQPAALREATRILRPGGRLAILDWRDDVEEPPGPPLSHRIPMRAAIHFLEHQGWELEQYCHIGPFSYLLVAREADQSQQS